MESLPLSFDPKIFLFSLVNFAILFFILKKFFFAPILDILEKRKSKIKDSLDNVEHIKSEKENLAAEKENIITSAKKESQEIIRQAEKMKKEILDKGKEGADKIIKASRESIEKERKELREEMNEILIDLVSTATEKALSNSTKDGQSRAVEKAIFESMKGASVEVVERK